MTACGMEFERLNAYVDAALPLADELDVRRHLDVCPGCRAAVETLLALKTAVAASAEVRPVPHTLRERLGALGSPRGRARIGRWQGVAALAGLLVALWVGRWALGRRDAGGDPLSEALVADHLHFLQEPAALEIASNDPERVGAWFRDKVPFPVRLPRLKSATLLGGRYCALFGHPVALAFYQAGGKRLSLFIADAASFPVPGRLEGGCGTALGDYRACILPAAPTVLAMVADREQTAAVLPELRDTVGRRD